MRRRQAADTFQPAHTPSKKRGPKAGLAQRSALRTDALLSRGTAVSTGRVGKVEQAKARLWRGRPDVVAHAETEEADTTEAAKRRRPTKKISRMDQLRDPPAGSHHRRA